MSAGPWASIRRAFPVTDDVVYLDNAAVGLVPRSAQQAMADYYAGVPYNAGVRLSPTVFYGGIGQNAGVVTDAVAAARAAVARVVGAQPIDVAFTRNATEALSVLAAGLGLGAGDEVLISELEHQSSALPWVRLAGERGFELTWLPADKSGVVDAADVERRISPRTRVIVMIHVSSLFGSVEPVEAVGGIAARHGVVFAVDASQAVGRIPFDMARINCDFAALSGRKALLGPQGVGVLVGRNGSLRRLRPLVIGSRSAVLEAVGDGEVRHAMAESPHHLEAGALNTGGIIGLGASVTFLEDLGWTAVFARIHALGRALWNAIAAVPRVEVYGDPEHSPRTGIISFNIEGRTSREVCEELWGLDRVITSPGIHGSPLALNKIGVPGTVRASVHCYNTEDEIQRLARGLEAIVTQRAHPRVSLN